MAIATHTEVFKCVGSEPGKDPNTGFMVDYYRFSSMERRLTTELDSNELKRFRVEPPPVVGENFQLYFATLVWQGGSMPSELTDVVRQR